jgi:hypothetical protein
MTESESKTVEVSKVETPREFDTPEAMVLTLFAELKALKAEAKGSLVAHDDAGKAIIEAFASLNQEIPASVLDAQLKDGHIRADFGEAAAKQMALRSSIFEGINSFMLPGTVKKHAASGSGTTPAKLDFVEEAAKKGTTTTEVLVQHLGDKLVQGTDYVVGRFDQATGRQYVSCTKTVNGAIKTAEFSGQYPGSLSWKVKEYFGLVAPAKAAPKAA